MASVASVKKTGFDNGYNDAIEQIKQALKKTGNGQGGEGGKTIKPKDMQYIPVNKGGSGGGNDDETGQNPRDNQPEDRGGGSQGKVRPEDVTKIDDNNGGIPGGTIDRKIGEDIEKREGHKPEGGSDSAEEKEWGEIAIKEASKLKGDGVGSFKSAILGLYKTKTDWKKALKKIVGMCISPEETRKAWANKNILVTQDRLSRTDKDKYDNVDYIAAFIDSSGSMSDDQLKLCLSEVLAVAQAKKPLKIYVIQCDTKIQEVRDFKSVDELKKYFKLATVKGRGGTELKPCWDLLKEDKRFKGKMADLVMVFTDGYLTQYKRDKKTMKNLCWSIIDNPAWECENKEPNTKTIHLSSKDVK